VPKIGRVAVGTRARKRSLALFWRTHSSSVKRSNSRARGAFQGASTGTSFDISFSSETTAARSGRISGSSGAVPVGPVSL
jgi:hypothetical protein